MTHLDEGYALSPPAAAGDVVWKRLKGFQLMKQMRTGKMKVTTHTDWHWQPSAEAVDALAAVLTSHWAAAKSQHAQLFWPKSSTWLRRQATRLTGDTDTAASIGEALAG
jgi:hypothetical protein